MSSLLEFPNLELAREEAAGWISRLSRDLSAEERVEFRRWCLNPANARALRQLSELWEELDVMKVLAEVLPDTVIPAAPAPRPQQQWRPAIAAGIAVFLAVGVVAGYQHYSRPAAEIAAAASYETAVGEYRSLTLEDGSTLAINTDSQVDVLQLGRTARDLRLERGEAHFTVAHDPRRPFRVQVGSQLIQAVGTAFDIRMHDQQGIEVVVTEGRVKLIPGIGAIDHLDRGQGLWITPDGVARLSTLDAEALSAKLAWRGGMVVFNGQKLGAALEEFSRYTAVRFVITDPKLRDIRVGGYFPAGDTEFLLEALHTSFGLDSTRAADGTIQIGTRR